MSHVDVVLDRESLLADVAGGVVLHALEERLRREGLTLGTASLEEHAALTTAEWLARGAPGARDPWLDPADHLVAGLEATLRDGRSLSIRPSPRRAVGPDLVALLTGMDGRYASITRAWLRVHPRDVQRPATHPLEAPRNPLLNEGESALLEAIDAALRIP